MGQVKPTYLKLFPDRDGSNSNETVYYRNIANVTIQESLISYPTLCGRGNG